MTKMYSGPKKYRGQKASTPDNKDSPSRGGGYREIGIAAVAAAVRCQHMPVPDDERVVKHVSNSARIDYFG